MCSFIRRDFFIHWFTDPPTVNIQKVKNLDANNFTILVKPVNLEF
jgi:hypothetical protein